MKNKKKKIGLIIGLLAVYTIGMCSGYFIGMSRTEAKQKKESEIAPVQQIENSIFSWDGEYILPEYADEIADVMELLHCGTIYQHISGDSSKEEVAAFLKRQSRMGNEVWYLAGDPSWAIEEDAQSMIKAVQKTAEWNEEAGDLGGFQGIVWDVEPYLLDEWDEYADGCMKQYIKNSKKAYELAQEKGLKILACIPYHYDDHGFQKELEQLIATGCDGIAVMNYNKTDEADHIQTEVRLAKKHDKEVIHITELQEPGKHGLKENNTYYNDGFEAVTESWNRLREHFGYRKLTFSLHHLRTAMELMEEGRLCRK